MVSDQVKHHYEVEKELAARLKSGSKEERRRLYMPLYDELFQRVPDHPQLIRKHSAEERRQHVEVQMQVLRPFLRADMTFADIGSGDCALSFEVAKRVKQVYALDVSEAITEGAAKSDKCQVILFDGYKIPLPDNSVDFAYSNQLMEHLHPDDAVEQLTDICRVLKPGGLYLCVTPNRLTGPHDVSKYFDTMAMGFHLKEYTNGELSAIFRKVGFRRADPLYALKGRFGRAPLSLVKLFEALFGCLPLGFRQRTAQSLPARVMLGVRMLGTK